MEHGQPAMTSAYFRSSLLPVMMSPVNPGVEANNLSTRHEANTSMDYWSDDFLLAITPVGVDNTMMLKENVTLSMENKIPLASKTILIILYTLTSSAAVIGNCLTVLVLTRGRRSNTDLRLFLINLTLADLIMAIFCIPFTFAYEMMDNWIFTDFMCHVVQCCQVVSVTASVSTNTAIGIDRLIAVKFPLRKRVTNSRSKLVILFIWIFAFSMGIIPLVMSGTSEKNGRLLCEEHWSDEHGKLAYSFFIILITYFLPVTVLSVTYTLIGRTLWRHKLPGNADDQRDAVQVQAKRKIVKMLVTIVLLFALCWLPLHLFIITITFNCNAFGDAANHIYFGVHWLSMANSFVNPVVYGFMNASFRADLAETCICWPWSHHRFKYRPTALRWRLADSYVHDASQRRRNCSSGKNAHTDSDLAFEIQTLCTCDRCQVSLDSTRSRCCSHDEGRNVFMTGKRVRESSPASQLQDSAVFKMKKKQKQLYAVVSRDVFLPAHPPCHLT